MVKAAFLEAMSNYDPLRFAVYTPAVIPLSERKKVAQILFSVLIGNEIPNIPEWFTSLFKQLASNRIFSDIQELSRNNPVLSAQIAAEIIRNIDNSIEELIDALNSWIVKEQEKEDEESKQILQLPPSGGGMSKSDMDVPGGPAAGEDISPQASESAQLAESETPNGTKGGIPTRAEIDETLKTRIEEILEKLTLLPLQQQVETHTSLSADIKQKAQSFLDKSLDDALKEILARARDWQSLYELLAAILPGLGWDHNPGYLKHDLLGKYLELSKLLDKIPQLKELANRLGRYSSLMGEKTWDPTAHGKSEVFSVERSGDIERVLPGELVQLGYSTTKYLFYSKLADKSLLTYELRGEGWTQPEKLERGPVVICIDSSGSMSGLPESIAKAVSLAVAKEANSQSRSVHMILFGSRNETKEFTFNKSENALKSLLGLLNLSFGGGTDFDSALRVALEKLKDEEFRMADVLFITDGYGEIAHVSNEIEQIKKTQGTSEDFDATQSISDETWILHLTSGASPPIAHLRARLRNPPGS
ncbi:MAG: VWA domain-containing protein [Candidatus Thorarchaeota archaeon]